MSKWFAYLHVNGTRHLKKYLSEASYREAKRSPFVKMITEPFTASSFQDAQAKARKKLPKPPKKDD